MKDFFKQMFATIAGILVLTLVTCILGVMSIVGMVASGSATKNVSDNTVLVINIQGVMEERAEDNIMAELTGQTVQNIGLDDMLNAIEKARNNDNIKGIYIEAGLFSADSYASMQAMRRALADFKKSGKWIVAYGDPGILQSARHSVQRLS